MPESLGRRVPFLLWATLYLDLMKSFFRAGNLLLSLSAGVAAVLHDSVCGDDIASLPGMEDAEW